MQQNLKTKIHTLRVLMKQQFGVDLKTHEAYEILAKMAGFDSYQSFLRGIDTVKDKIFEGKVIHAIADCGGGTEVGLILSEILKNQNLSHFVTDKNEEFTLQNVNLKENFKAGIVHFTAKTDENMLFFSDLSSATDFTPTFHVSISKRYGVALDLNAVDAVLKMITSNHHLIALIPSSILLWIFEDDCSAPTRTTTLNKTILSADLIDLSKLVERYADTVKTVWVPHYAGPACFAKEQDIKGYFKRDALLADIVAQMQDINVISK